MFFGLEPWHLLVVIGAALLIFGPDKLPGVARDAGKVLRQLRRMANDVREDLAEELGPEIAGLDLRSMHPKTLIHKHLLDPALDEVDEERATEPAPAATAPVAAPAAEPAPVATPAAPASGTPYDLDAT